MRQLPAGRELDGIIAEKVMRWQRYTTFDSDPRFSSDIAPAFLVVEKMGATPGPNGDHYTFLLDYVPGHSAIAIFAQGEDWEGRGEAATVPHAICLAALEAVEKGLDYSEPPR
mgnify:CR=1 FL=1